MGGRKARISGLKLLLKVLSFFHILPFRWNSASDQLQECGPIHNAYWLTVGPIFYYSQSLFVSIQFYRFLSKFQILSDALQLTPLRISMLLSSGVVTYSGYSTLTLVFYRKRKEIVELFNQVLNLRRILLDAGVSLKRNVSGFYLIILAVSFRSAAVISVAILSPSKPPNAYSLLRQEWMGPTLHAIYVLYHSLTTITAWMCLLVIITVLFLYLQTMTAALKHTLAQIDQRKPEPALRQLALYRRLFEEAYAFSILPVFLAVMSILITISTFGVLRFFGKIRLDLYAFFLAPLAGITMVCSVLFGKGLQIYSLSARLNRKVDLLSPGRAFKPLGSNAQKMRLNQLHSLEVRGGL